MRQAIMACLLLLYFSLAQASSAQSTISDLPLELTFGAGAWGALLPGYDLGTNASGGSAFHDDLDNGGGLFELKAIRRFLGTRTSLETKAFYGLAGSSNASGPIGVDIPNPIDGASNLFGGGRTGLDSDLNHYGFDIAIRDTWRTTWGGLSAGCGFSYMAFDQQFDAAYDGFRMLREDLDTEFRGGKAFVGWDGCLFGRRSNFDLALGYFDTDTDYEFSGGAVAGALQQELSRDSATVEASFTSRGSIGDIQVGWTLSAMYITDMPTIEHNFGSAVSFDSDDAATLRAMFEILL